VGARLSSSTVGIATHRSRSFNVSAGDTVRCTARLSRFVEKIGPAPASASSVPATVFANKAGVSQMR
jgi:hypothetical protein